jgi:unsaturated rhamnogalacturonyl hydrolase
MHKIFLILLTILSICAFAPNEYKAAIRHAGDSADQKIVVLDYYFNNEWRKSKEDSTLKVQYHYTWEDTTFSGFSELGTIITRLNGVVKSLRHAPTAELLQDADMYIIVDPDTKKETAEPNYIDENSRSAIAEWVKNGGILVLLANDSANCEFDSLNLLAKEFGITFNGDSKNRVTGDNFYMGKVEDFHNNPVFTGVKSIYLKEISTINTVPPAEAFLSHEGNIIMSFSEYGEGFVFAIGDPWLYNEYIDNRKLPEEFENYKAAEKLFGYLLHDLKK